MVRLKEEGSIDGRERGRGKQSRDREREREERTL